MEVNKFNTKTDTIHKTPDTVVITFFEDDEEYSSSDEMDETEFDCVAINNKNALEEEMYIIYDEMKNIVAECGDLPLLEKLDVLELSKFLDEHTIAFE